MSNHIWMRTEAAGKLQLPTDEYNRRNLPVKKQVTLYQAQMAKLIAPVKYCDRPEYGEADMACG